jgi:acyl transferase domain-containing protein
MFVGLDKGHFLSPSGQCKSFDAAADGYSRGEGCGVFVLKRLADAMAENDRILGVIRGVEVNQSGQAHSITHPHGPTQRALFKQLLHHSNVDPNSVNVVEAHGTGTQAGDTNELDSIRAALNGNRAPNNPLYVTSIKANIGHLEAASGSASLAKVLLMFQHRTIPRQVSLETLNPLFAPLDSDNTVIATNNVAWTSVYEGKPRIAMINNFGAAGSNASLLVEEYIHKAPRAELPDDDSCLVFGISAKDKIILEKLRSQLVQRLQTPRKNDAYLADIAYTLTARRQIFLHRIAIAATSKDELIQKLQSAHISDAPVTKKSVVLVFSGQGCQYRGMGSALYESSPTFRHHIDECDGILVSLGFPGIKGLVVGGGARTDGQSAGREDFQSALFALQYALLKVWQSWGIKPVAVVGHRCVSV